MGLSRQEYWSAWPCPPPGDLPDPGIEPVSLALQADSLPSEEMPTSEESEVGPLLVGRGGVISHMGRGLPGRHCSLIEINSGQRFILGFLGVLTPYLHHTVLTPGKAETPQVTPGDPSTEREPKQAGLGAGMGLQQEVCLFRWISCITDT